MLMGNHLSQMGQLRVEIRRNHIVEDALQQLTVHMEDLHKPLRVTFLSEDGKSREEAVDEGGVSKVRYLCQMMNMSITNSDGRRGLWKRSSLSFS